jgi:hypothetical protein
MNASPAWCNMRYLTIKRYSGSYTMSSKCESNWLLYLKRSDRPQMWQDVQSLRNFTKHCRNHNFGTAYHRWIPLFHLALGWKLRSPEIYMDALRHIVGSYDLTRHPDRFCAELSMDDSNFRVAAYKKREKLDAITTALGLVLNVWQLFWYPGPSLRAGSQDTFDTSSKDSTA